MGKKTARKEKQRKERDEVTSENVLFYLHGHQEKYFPKFPELILELATSK